MLDLPDEFFCLSFYIELFNSLKFCAFHGLSGVFKTLMEDRNSERFCVRDKDSLLATIVFGSKKETFDTILNLIIDKECFDRENDNGFLH